MVPSGDLADHKKTRLRGDGARWLAPEAACSAYTAATDARARRKAHTTDADAT